jgi:hypothetical protein
MGELADYATAHRLLFKEHRTFACPTFSIPRRPEGTRFFRHAGAKKRHTIKIKYHVAVHPEPVEGQAKSL